MRRRCAVVTGGAGFLGSHLCDRLAEDGWHVVCVDDLCTGSEANLAPVRRAARDFTFLHQDVSDPWPLEERVDTVFHLASPASPRDYQSHALGTLRAGSTGTLRAVEVASQHGARLVLASTSEVYGDPQVHPQPEHYRGNVDPCGPRSMYDEAKRFGEAVVAAAAGEGVDAGIVRIFNTYGPRMRRGDGRVVPAFVEQALTGRPFTIAGDGAQTRSLCYVDDTVEGLVRMGATAGELGPVNLGNPHELTVRELASLVARAAGVPDRVVRVPRPEQDPQVRCPDISRACSVLGWEPKVDLEDGLARTLAWWRETQDLESPLLA